MPVSSFIPSKVKVCSYCNSQCTTDTQGFQSLHNMALLTTGEVRQSDNPEYYKHIIESHDKVFPGDTIQNNKRRLREDIRNKRIKVIKNIFEQEPELEILPE